MDVPEEFGVHRLGWVSEDAKAALLGRADVFALPSKLDGFLIVFIEAMAYGCLCLGPRGYGCEDRIEKDGFGFVCDVDNDADVVATLMRLMEATESEDHAPSELVEKARKLYGFQRWRDDVRDLVARWTDK